MEPNITQKNDKYKKAHLENKKPKSVGLAQ
jgi:hypothetical protein